ncbi:MAG: hypothetical protein HPY55_11090 [Firmicutes bacterium]|nr:hypothetical protein [Bacillota bacterium]
MQQAEEEFVSAQTGPCDEWGRLKQYQIAIEDGWFVKVEDHKEFFEIRVYASDVALVVVVHRASDQSGPRDGVCSSWHDVRDLGPLLRSVSSCAEQVGLELPCHCVVCVGEEGKLREEIEKAASDQDWHRGAFTITPVADGREALQVAAYLLGELRGDDLRSRLDPITPNALVSNLDDRIRSSGPGSHRDLLELVKDVIVEQEGLGGRLKTAGVSPEARFRHWVDERWAVIEKEGERRDEQDKPG